MVDVAAGHVDQDVEPVRCGGALVHPGDIVVADEEGVAVVPAAGREQVRQAALAKLAQEAAESLDAWEIRHRARIDQALRGLGFES